MQEHAHPDHVICSCVCVADQRFENCLSEYKSAEMLHTPTRDGTTSQRAVIIMQENQQEKKSEREDKTEAALKCEAKKRP